MDVEYIKSRVEYDPETGIFTRKASNSWLSLPGDKITNKDKDGYIRVGISNRRFRAHRLAWFIQFGEWPDGEIDHINGIRDDNSISNLRVVSRSTNMKNVAKSSKNTSGFTGVCWDRARSKWKVSIQVGGKVYNIGRYDILEDACKARIQAEVIHGFHENHGRELLEWPKKYKKSKK